MERDEWIRRVIAEVERQLAMPAPPKRLALVEAGPDLKAVLGRLLQMGDVSVVLCGRAHKAPEAAAWGELLPVLVEDMDRLASEILPGLEQLVLPNLRPGTAARVALGLENGTVPTLVQAALWAGVPVVATPGWAPPPSAAYRQLYDGYLQRMREYGVTVADSAAPAPCAAPARSTAPALVAASDPVAFAGKVVTEADVVRLIQEGINEIAVPHGIPVTALAVDTARARGLRLIRR